MSTSATARLTRLLALVPWVTRNQGIELAAAAQHFGVSEKQIIKDLELLFVCGTPGHLPDDLIDARWESGHVYVSNAEDISQPLRLSVDESVVLIAGLQALSELSDAQPHGGLESALEKLMLAVQEQAGAVASVHVPDGAQHAEVTAQISTAMRQNQRLALEYYVPSRDEVTQREVSGYRLIHAEGHGYLHAFCHTADDERIFRIDRIRSVQLLDASAIEPQQAPHSAQADSLSDGQHIFTPGEQAWPVTLELRDGARWVAEYYPIQSQQEQPDGSLHVTLLTTSREWVMRLAMRLAGRASVIAPDDLAKDVRARAQATLAEYAHLRATAVH